MSTYQKESRIELCCWSSWQFLMMVIVYAIRFSSAAMGVAGDSNLTLKNDVVQRVFREANGTWRTLYVSRADGSDKLEIDSSEFWFKLLDGTELTADNYKADGSPIINQKENGKISSIEINYIPHDQLPPDAPAAITVKYLVDKGPYLRKTLTLVMQEGDAIDQLQVERFKTSLSCDLGGKRTPVFIGDAWFAGLEYPSCETTRQGGLVTLSHYPGLVKKQNEQGRWIIESKIAVLGTGLKGDPIELAFSDYVEAIRLPRANHNYVAYNTYFDINADECTIDKLLPKMACYKENLVDPYGVKMDAFTIDNSYNRSIWDYTRVWALKESMYPNGFGPLREGLAKLGTHLGLWNSVAGFHLTLPDYYEKAGCDEKCWYCTAAPHYNAAYREAIKHIITDGDVPYLKLDYLILNCTSDKHGHLPDERHGTEANTDAHIELMAAMRQVRPDIFIDLMAHNQLTPWWLMYADDSYGGGYDVGYSKSHPQMAPFEWACSDRDVNFYKLYKMDRLQMPISSLTPHGLIRTGMTLYGGTDETLREWSNYVVLNWGRGVQTKLLYITAEMLNPDQWRVLGQATRWAIENSKTLEKAVMTGGDPAKGESYGFACWNGDHGIITLRNPDMQERAIDVPFDKSVHYRGTNGKRFRGRVIYPYVEEIPKQFTSGQPIRLTIPGYSVMVFELQPGEAPKVNPAVSPASVEGTGVVGEDKKLEINVMVPDEEMQRCDLILIGEGNGFDFYNLILNGEPVQKSRWGRGDDGGWFLRGIDLKPSRGKQVKITASLTNGDTKLFCDDASVSAWLITDRFVKSVPAPKEHLPWAIAQDYRRQTIRILAPTKVELATPRLAITEADLKGIKAAKLHLVVYGLKDEPEIEKSLLINGQKVAQLAANPESKQINGGNYAAAHNLWQEVIFDLKPEQFELLKLRNTFEVVQTSGQLFADFYKITGPMLAVQLVDGTWVGTNADYAERCNTRHGWAHAFDGIKVFENNTRSGPIELSF